MRAVAWFLIVVVLLCNEPLSAWWLSVLEPQNRRKDCLGGVEHSFSIHSDPEGSRPNIRGLILALKEINRVCREDGTWKARGPPVHSQSGSSVWVHVSRFGFWSLGLQFQNQAHPLHQPRVPHKTKVERSAFVERTRFGRLASFSK